MPGSQTEALSIQGAWWAGVLDSARRLAPLAWPVLVGQVAVLAFATVDTILVARFAAADLAALAVGGAAYLTVFIGLMGVVVAVGPIAGQLFGARQLVQAGRQVHQAVWVALGLSLLGSTLLLFPAPFLALSRASPDVADKVRGYLFALAFSLPASLLFSVYRGFNTAVSRPKAVMALQVAGLALKVPLSSALVWGVPLLGVPSLGVVGCGLATAIVMWAQMLIAWQVVQRDAFYAPFQIMGRGLDAPDRKAILAQLRLGIPMGSSILVEVTGFAFMAFFISRIGTTAVAGHQVATNLVSLMFMVPLAMANASGTLVAQRIGAGDPQDARRLGWHSLGIGLALAAVMGSSVLLGQRFVLGLYTSNPAVAAAAVPLIAWLVVFHIADAAQTIAAFVLRAYRIATVPVFIYVAALWGVGLGGGYVLAFNVGGQVPAALQGAPGYWFASTAGLVVAGVALIAFMGWVLRSTQSAQLVGGRA
jgi:MATE family multidrug resistance protein